MAHEKGWSNGSEPAFPCADTGRISALSVKVQQAAKDNDEITMIKAVEELKDCMFFGLTKREVFTAAALMGGATGDDAVNRADDVLERLTMRRVRN